jgi:hypothetical protein
MQHVGDESKDKEKHERKADVITPEYLPQGAVALPAVLDDVH